MKTNIIQLISLFDELLPATNEEQGIYWFKSYLNDDKFITLIISVYENIAGISVYTNSETAITSLNLNKCIEIRILDKNKKCLEIIQTEEKGRCFISFSELPIIEYNS